MSNPSNNVSMLNPVIPVNQGIYEEDSTQQCALGTRIEVGERVFRYAKAGAGLLAGQVVCAPLMVTTAMGCTVAADTASINKRTVTITAGTDIAANSLAEGYFAVSSSGLAGGGTFLKIKSHASFGSGSATCVLNLYDSIPVSTIAAGPATVIPSIYNGVIIGSQAVGVPVGVAPIAVTSGNYCWVQTWGIGAPRHQAATPVSAVLHLGTIGETVCTFDATTNGGVAGIAKQIGYNINIAATAHHANPAYLTIQP